MDAGRTVRELEIRKVVALEKISRHLSAIEEVLLLITDGNKKSLRMEDIERAKVYSTHLGKNLSDKKSGKK